MSQHPETQAIRTQTPVTAQKEHSTPLFLTSSFIYDSAEDMAAAFSDESLDVNIYTRFSNPTVDEFIKKWLCWKVPKRVLQREQEWLLFFQLL